MASASCTGSPQQRRQNHMAVIQVILEASRQNQIRIETSLPASTTTQRTNPYRLRRILYQPTNLDGWIWPRACVEILIARPQKCRKLCVQLGVRPTRVV